MTQLTSLCCSKWQVCCRERTQASDFNAALYEHTQYLRRKKEALEMRAVYESSAESAEGAAGASQSDFSLKPGETITLKLAKVSPWLSRLYIVTNQALKHFLMPPAMPAMAASATSPQPAWCNSSRLSCIFTSRSTRNSHKTCSS